MTIFDTGYSSFDYRPAPMWARLWPLIHSEFAQIFRTKKGILVFVLCIAFLVVKALAMYFSLNPDSAQTAMMIRQLERFSPGLSPLRPEFYINHATDWGWIPLLLLTGLVSVRSIAADRSVNALEIYWTRGISPWGYFIAKWLGSYLLLAAAFFAGPLVLWLYGLLAAPDAVFFDTTIQFMPQALLALTLMCLIISFLAVGFSALSESPNVATFLWMLLIGGTMTVGQILTTIMRHTSRHEVYEPPWFNAVCPVESMNRIQEDLVGLVPGPSDFEQIWIAWAFLAGYVAFLLWRLRRFLRTTEAIG